MKTKVYPRKANGYAAEKWIEPKLQLAMLVLIAGALAVASCESSGSPSSSSPAAISQPAVTGGPGFATNLSGRWFHDGQPTSIDVAPDGRNLTIINEQGQRSGGYANSPYELEIPSLRMKGQVGHGGRRIAWTNGTEWTREPQRHGSGSGQRGGQDLNGPWSHDGKPTSISVSSGGSVTITNEQGQSSRGQMSGNDISIPGGLRGHVSNNGRRISWSNGTEWTR